MHLLMNSTKTTFKPATASTNNFTRLCNKCNKHNEQTWFWGFHHWHSQRNITKDHQLDDLLDIKVTQACVVKNNERMLHEPFSCIHLHLSIFIFLIIIITELVRTFSHITSAKAKIHKL